MPVFQHTAEIRLIFLVLLKSGRMAFMLNVASSLLDVLRLSRGLGFIIFLVNVKSSQNGSCKYLYDLKYDGNMIGAFIFWFLT